MKLIEITNTTDTKSDIIIKSLRFYEQDAVDILLVSVLLFYLIRFIRDRRAGKLAVGQGESAYLHQRLYVQYLRLHLSSRRLDCTPYLY